MRLIKIIIVLLILSFIACKKEIDYPIIEPESYFPVYPNSWWKYLVDDSLTAIDSTSDSYILHNYPLGFYTEEKTDLVYVPYYYCSSLSPIGINGPIYKYDKITYNAMTPWQRWPILSEEIGFSFYKDPLSQYPADNEAHTVKAKIFNGQDSVLIIVGTFFVNNYPQFTSSKKRYQEFVKGVGLVQDIVYDTITFDTVSKKILVDHHISYRFDF